MEHIIGAEGELKGDLAKKWMEETLGEKYNNKYSAMAFLEENKIKAAAIFVNYTGSNIDFHYYGSRITKANYKKILNYVFNFLGCNRLTTIPLREDTKSICVLPRLGFMHEATLKYYYGVDDSKDGLVYKITKERAKDWIEIKEK